MTSLTATLRDGIRAIRADYEGRSTALAEDMRARCDAAIAYLDERAQRELRRKVYKIIF